MEKVFFFQQPRTFSKFDAGNNILFQKNKIDGKINFEFKLKLKLMEKCSSFTQLRIIRQINIINLIVNVYCTNLKEFALNEVTSDIPEHTFAQIFFPYDFIVTFY